MRYSTPVSIYDAIVPAGGTIDTEFAVKAGTSVKALIEFNGVTMIETVLQSLKDSGKVRNIVVIGDHRIQEIATRLGAYGLEPGQTGPENIFRGLDKLQQLEGNLDRAMIVTCDLPFLSSEMVQKYIELCPTDKDICVPIIDADEFTKTYPGTTSTFVKTKDGTFTIGGMFMMNGNRLRDLRPAIERVFAKRKSKVGMAMLIGPGFVLKWLTKSLTIRDLERKIESMLGCTGSAVRGAPVELAYDIDDLEDYDYAMKHVGART